MIVYPFDTPKYPIVERHHILIVENPILANLLIDFFGDRFSKDEATDSRVGADTVNNVFKTLLLNIWSALPSHVVKAKIDQFCIHQSSFHGLKEGKFLNDKELFSYSYNYGLYVLMY